MSGTPSFERFNYLLRTNKHIERKLVFDLLQEASVRIGFSEHWYLGFGSMWFGDFRLADRQLGIRDMISVECDQAARADYNRPFGGVQVIEGMSGDAIKAFPQERWQRPVIAWLDYDGALTEDVIADVDGILQNAAPNSVLVITLNGTRGTYRARRTDGMHTREETGVGVIESLLGGSSIAARFQPTQTPAGAWRDVTDGLFPECLADAVSTYMQHRIMRLARTHAGQRLVFYPLYLLHHKDGTDMVTVGGAIAPEMDDSPWHKSLASQRILAGGGGNAATFNRLDLIPLTIKEKMALDTCLPIPQDDQAFLAQARQIGLQLADAEMMKYRRFYRHFPMFVETPL